MNKNIDIKKIAGAATVFFQKKYYGFFWILMFVCVLLAGWLFYLYAWQISAPADTQADLTKINYPLYQKISNRLQKKQLLFRAEATSAYPDIFR